MSFDVFDVSASGMQAQRIKLDTISSNIANMNTTRNPDGTPGVYVKKEVSFQSVYSSKMNGISEPSSSGGFSTSFSPQDNAVVLRGGVNLDQNNGISQGVEVAAIQDSKDPFRMVYDPSHPDADSNGYVKMPNINVVEEMVNMVSASKAYEANAAAAEAAKSMISAASRI